MVILAGVIPAKSRRHGVTSRTAARAVVGALLVVLFAGGHGLFAGHGAELPVHEAAHALESKPGAPEEPAAPSALHLAGWCLVFAGALLACLRRPLEGLQRERRRRHTKRVPGLRRSPIRPPTRSVLALTGVRLR
jgi:hypothetical protein